MELSRIELFQDLKQDDLTELEKITNKKECKKGEIIFLEGEEGDAVYFIKSGLIRVFKVEESGREKTLTFLGNGEFFGEMAFFENHKQRSAFVQAVEETVLYIINKESFLKLIRDKPSIAFKMIAALSHRLREANDQIRNLSFKTVKERLLVELEKLAEKHGKSVDEGILIESRITHEQLASIVGTSRERVTKLLGKLLEEDKLKIEDKHFILLR